MTKPLKIITNGLRQFSYFLFIVVCALSPVLAQTMVETKVTETIASGIEHWTIKRGDFAIPSSDRWQIHVLTINPKYAQIKLARAMDEIVGTETTSSMAGRFGAVAAINAGYFRTTGIYRGEPNGIFFWQGNLLSEDYKNRAALIIGAQPNQFAIAHAATTAKVLLGKKLATAIDGINRPRANGEIIIFTPEFHRTTLTNQSGDEYLVRNNRVVAVHKNSGSSHIPPDGLVISVSGNKKIWAQANIHQGTKIQLKFQTSYTPQIAFSPANIVGGGPQLVHTGKIISDTESYSPANFLDQRHPRTAFGWRADGTILLVTIDGRQPVKSVGMTIPELANLMLELGCVEAMNLDGGGSTTMVVNNQIVNSVSDATGERPVSDALLIFKK